ncbi:MAG: RdgB/HAM1 family non-canonical purine NTP pyrophosphatase [Bacilli bacterium]|nr:RdgB/HAM1 family non-canonical purine NTP pyrophosphatase [Bacilli bacterium]
MKILIATHNKYKLKEIKQNANSKIDFISLDDLEDNNVVIEDGYTFNQNAYKKAKYYFDLYGLPTLADDSGLVVKALKGDPGIYSSRYGGIEGDDANNNKKLLTEMKNSKNRSAYYYCSFCYIDAVGKVHYFSGKINGQIAIEEKGKNGFGYDSLFIPYKYQKTFGELNPEIKSKISHRSKALVKFFKYISRVKISNTKIIKYNIKKIFKTSKIKVIKRLIGGLSNYNYLVDINNELYVYRIPGSFGDFFVNRKIEIDNLTILSKLKFCFLPEYFNINNGHKISRYIDGFDLDVLEEKDYEECATILRKLHSYEDTFSNNYEPFKRLEKFEKNLKDLNFQIDPMYYSIKKFLFKYKLYLESQKLRMSHGDSQVRNFIKGDKIYLMDYEFTGNNDPVYDIACYANRNLDEGYKLLQIYYKKDIDNDKILRFYLWRLFQNLQWYNVAVFKELKGLSKELKIDFMTVSKNYLKKAEIIIAKIKEKNL